jgi:hypothetical protein
MKNVRMKEIMAIVFTLYVDSIASVSLTALIEYRLS